MKKWNMPMLILMAVLGAAVAISVIGCAEDPEEVTGETIEQVPEAAEEVLTDEPEEPGQEEAPGVDVEEMTTDTPPQVREDEEGEADNMDEADADTPPAPDAGD